MTFLPDGVWDISAEHWALAELGSNILQSSLVSKTSQGCATLLTNSDGVGPASGRVIQSRKCPSPVCSAA